MRRITRFLPLALLATAACSSSTTATTDTTVVAIETSSTVTTAPPPPTPSDPASSVVAPEPEPQLEPSTCADPPDGGTACYRLTLPADPDDPSNGIVSLPIVVLRATAPAPLQPVVIPGGGPGFATTGQVRYWAQHAFRTDHDIVLYAQRGTGDAIPSLECPEHDDEVIAALQSAEEPPNDRYAISEAAMVCRSRLEAEGIDFDDYDTAMNALDLDEIRQALGYEQWTIVGISYGARLALESMRSFPDGIYSVILDSVYDVTSGGLAANLESFERAIAMLTDANPTLAESLEAARTLFNDVPWSGEADLGNGPQTFVITGDDLIGGLVEALYDTEVIPALPGVIQSLANGDSSAIPEFLRLTGGSLTGSADAMQLSVDCADNAGLGRLAADLAATEDPGRMTLAAALAGPPCDEWDVEPTRADFNEPVVSDIPALVLAGGYDPITPPGATLGVAEQLSNSKFYLFPEFGHGVTGNDVCATALGIQFLTDPTAPIIATCLDD